MPPEEFDSLDAKSLKGLVLSLLAKIDELFEQNKKLLEQNSALLARIAELEGNVADTQEQRVALEEMYRELSRSADDRLLSEVEQMLVLASQQLQLAGNVRGALVALQAADQRLAHAEKLAATPLRRAITQDMERLKAVPQVDTVGLAVKLDGLIAQSESLPLVISETLPAARVASRARYADDAGAVQRAARDFWEEMKGLVRIRELDQPDLALLTPAQAYFLRENIKLRLLNARLALLSRQFGTAQSDLREVQIALERHFDRSSRRVNVMNELLRQVGSQSRGIVVPRPDETLAALTAVMAGK